MKRIVGLLLWVALAGSAFAEEEPVREGQIVVTARRLARELEATGASVSVVTGEDIEARQVSTAAEAISALPGVFVSDGPPGTPSSLFLRGAGSNQTVVVLDGVQVNDPTIGGQFNFFDLGLANVERIEVLRGAASSLYGSDAAGGVVNLVTRRGEGEPSVRGLLEGGSYGHYRAAARLSGEEGIAGFSLEGGRDRWTNDLGRNGSVTDSMAGSLRIEPRPELTIDFRGRYIEAEAQDPWDFPFGPQIPKDPNLRRERVSWLLGASVEHSPCEWFTGKVDASFFRVNSLLTNGPDAAGDPIELRSRSIAEVSTLSATSTLEPQGLPDWLEVTALFGWESQIEQSVNRVSSAFGASPEIDRKVRNRALFGLLELAILDRLVFSGGVRRDSTTAFGRETSPSASLLYRLRETGTRLRSNWGTAFRAPKPVEIYDPFVGNPGLGPEESETFDVGLEQELLGGDLLLGATWFRLRTEGLIAWDPDSGILQNVNRARTRGFELSAAARPSAEVEVRAWFTVQEPDDLSARRQLPGRPRWFGGGEVRARLDPVVLSLEAQLSDETPSTGRITPGGSKRSHPGRKVLVALRAEVRVAPGVTLFGRVENLLDDEWYDSETLPNGLGRGFYVGLRVER